MPDTERKIPRTDGFLARWSERKRAASESQSPTDLDDAPSTHETVADGAAAGLGTDPEPGPTPAPERRLTDADMPPLESLDGRADYSGFLSPGVSPGLRRQALAQLFRSAHLNVTDGLDDFDEDFTGFKPMGGLVTADMRYHAERAAHRLATLAEGAGDTPSAEERAGTIGQASPEVVASTPEAPAGPPTDAGAASDASAEAARLARDGSDHRGDQPRTISDGDIA